MFWGCGEHLVTGARSQTPAGLGRKARCGLFLLAHIYSTPRGGPLTSPLSRGRVSGCVWDGGQLWEREEGKTEAWRRHRQGSPRGEQSPKDGSLLQQFSLRCLRNGDFLFLPLLEGVH